MNKEELDELSKKIEEPHKLINSQTKRGNINYIHCTEDFYKELIKEKNYE